ncbi:hypothetical protein CPC08DRAFT_563676 [Agrocybe pediades]|nr:hypothetical protein CPC08DRAFT_563676 [Agrocybe pediades]
MLKVFDRWQTQKSIELESSNSESMSALPSSYRFLKSSYSHNLSSLQRPCAWTTMHGTSHLSLSSSAACYADCSPWLDVPRRKKYLRSSRREGQGPSNPGRSRGSARLCGPPLWIRLAQARPIRNRIPLLGGIVSDARSVFFQSFSAASHSTPTIIQQKKTQACKKI